MGEENKGIKVVTISSEREDDNMTYQEIAYDATKVESLKQDNIFEGKIKFYYGNDKNNIIIFDTIEEAMVKLLDTVDLSKYYKFYNVFYDAKTGDTKRYNKYIMVMARKTVAVKNNVLNYITAKSDNSGAVSSDSEYKPLNQINKDIEQVNGLGQPILVQIEKTNSDGSTTYDVRDNFIVDEFTNDNKAITCNVIFNQLNKIKNSPLTIDNKFDLTLIDVTGLPLKSTINDNITVNDALDIYREFVGGTTKDYNNGVIIDDEENTEDKDNAEKIEEIDSTYTS